MAALVMLLSLVINSYIIGKFGDNLFKNVDYRIEKAKSNVATAHPTAAELRGMTCRRLITQFLFKF